MGFSLKAALAAALMAPAALADATGCVASGGAVIGFALDTSGSISASSFDTMTAAVRTRLRV